MSHLAKSLSPSSKHSSDRPAAWTQPAVLQVRFLLLCWICDSYCRRHEVGSASEREREIREGCRGRKTQSNGEIARKRIRVCPLGRVLTFLLPPDSQVSIDCSLFTFESAVDGLRLVLDPALRRCDVMCRVVWCCLVCLCYAFLASHPLSLHENAHTGSASGLPLVSPPPRAFLFVRPSSSLLAVIESLWCSRHSKGGCWRTLCILRDCFPCLSAAAFWPAATRSPSLSL